MFQKKKSQLRFVSLEERIVFDASGVIFVDATAASGGDGSSWSHAYNNLESALAAASASAGADQIWIADGTYKPSGGSNTSTFDLPDDVQLYGGFKGNESSLAKRNPLKYITVLSGDFLNNDLINPLDAGYAASKADNAWHVLTASGVNASLDGLSVVKGYAGGSDPYDNKGGGLLIISGSDIVMNKVVFDQNAANINGGGVLVSGSGTTLIVDNSLFTNNHHYRGSTIVTQPTGGGAIAVLDDGYVEVSKSLFKENTAGIGHGPGSVEGNPQGHDGAAIALNDSSGKVTNSVFIGNISQSGGALTVQSLAETTPHTFTVESSTFIGNFAYHVGGAIDVLGVSPPHPDSLVSIRNSSFLNNEGVIMGGAVYFDSYNGIIENSTFINNKTTGAGGAVINLEFLNSANALFLGPLPPHLLTITNSSFVNNSVTGDLGAFAHFEAVFGNVFDFQANNAGGAILNAHDGNMIITGSSFINNRATNADGGAIQNGGWDATLFGIPINAYGGNLTVETSAFTNNRSTGNGGAIASSSLMPLGTPGGPTLDVSDSTFVSNKALNGGAIYLERVSASILGNLFKHSNNATIADQIYGEDSLVNGNHTSNSAAVIANLKATNIFKNLDESEDFFFV